MRYDFKLSYYYTEIKEKKPVHRQLGLMRKLALHNVYGHHK